MNKKVIFEAIKEPLRLLVLAIIPFAIAYSAGYDAQWAITATIVLRFIDKYLFELGKARKGDSKLDKGLTRF